MCCGLFSGVLRRVCGVSLTPHCINVTSHVTSLGTSQHTSAGSVWCGPFLRRRASADAGGAAKRQTADELRAAGTAEMTVTVEKNATVVRGVTERHNAGDVSLDTGRP